MTQTDFQVHFHFGCSIRYNKLNQLWYKIPLKAQIYREVKWLTVLSESTLNSNTYDIQLHAFVEADNKLQEKRKAHKKVAKWRNTS